MATKQSGCLGRIISAVFTSVLAPILVGIALHGLNAGDDRAAPAAGVPWGAWVSKGMASLPDYLQFPAIPDAAPTRGTAGAPGAGSWAQPIPLRR